MQRYFAETIDGNITLNKDDIFHITKVMRSRVGDTFQIVTDDKLYLAKVVSIDPFSFSISETLNENHELNGYIRLLYCLPKGEKLDLVIQKAVEMGASEIVLVNSSRCVRRLDKSNSSSKLVRFNKIIKEASEQCKRSNLMKLTDIIDYKDIGNYKADKSFIAYEASDTTLKDLDKELRGISNKTINVLVGSEGGFSKEEVDYAVSKNYKVITLGNRILRSETSCFYILSLLSFYMEANL
jgi:16S rRNA (uracil1498-N3)-methyltransferase